MLVKCPICDSETNDSPIKTWYYNKYFVKNYICTKCGDKFNIYYVDGIEKFTVPKRIDRTKYY